MSVQQGRNQREQDLEQHDVGQSDQTHRAVFRIEQALAMFKGRLRRAEHPAKALAEQAAESVRRFRQADSLLVVENLVARLDDGDRQVGILGQRVRSKAAQLLDQFPPPGTDGAGNHRDAVEQVEGTAIEVLAGDVFECLPPA